VAETYKTYDPNKYDEKSARWAIDFVDNLANLRFQDVIQNVWTVRDPFEKDLFDKQDEIEKQAIELLKKNPKEGREFLTNYSNDKMNEVTKMYNELRNQIITKYTNNHE
jgi:dipeptidase